MGWQNVVCFLSIAIVFVTRADFIVTINNGEYIVTLRNTDSNQVKETMSVEKTQRNGNSKLVDNAKYTEDYGNYNGTNTGKQ